MAETVSISVAPETVKAVIQAQIHAAVCKALEGTSQKFLEEAVRQVLCVKVNPSSGKAESYSTYNTMTWVEWAGQHAIREVVEEEIKVWLKEHRDMLAAEIRKSLASSKTAMVKSLADSAADSVLNGIKFSFNVEAK